MPRLFPNDSELCVPLIIGEGRSDVGSRIGGLPPAEILPRMITPATRYFATIRISDNPSLELTVFLSFDFDEMADNTGVIHSSDKLVQVIAHSESTRVDASDILSDLAPHPIVHGSATEDWVVDDEGNRIVRSNHKLGGRPYLVKVGGVLSGAVVKNCDEGYFQVVEIDFPNSQDGDISGNWPFADGIFHILGKEPLEDCAWRYFWQY